jgi:hypothetical protein
MVTWYNQNHGVFDAGQPWRRHCHCRGTSSAGSSIHAIRATTRRCRSSGFASTVYRCQRVSAHRTRRFAASVDFVHPATPRKPFTPQEAEQTQSPSGGDAESKTEVRPAMNAGVLTVRPGAHPTKLCGTSHRPVAPHAVLSRFTIDARASPLTRRRGFIASATAVRQVTSIALLVLA